MEDVYIFHTEFNEAAQRCTASVVNVVGWGKLGQQYLLVFMLIKSWAYYLPKCDFD